MSRQSRDPYFNGRRAKRILVTVFLLHLAIIVLPLIFASLTEHFEPRIIVMNVGMADIPAGDSLDSGDIASSELPTPANEPELCIVPRWLDRFLDLIGVNVLDCRRAGAEQNPTDHIAP